MFGNDNAEEKKSIITSPLESEDLGFEQKSALSEETTMEAVSSGDLSFTLSGCEGTDQKWN